MSEVTDISFAQIPANLEVPGAYMEFSSANANNGTAAASYRYLLLGQMLAAGTAKPLVPVRIVAGKAQADIAFGKGSMLSNMVAAAVAQNGSVELWALPTLDNAAGVAAAGSIAFTGTATAPGSITAYIGYSGLITPAQIAVAAGDTAAVVATNLQEAIAEVTDLPVTATAANGTVTLTARHKGADAGNIDIRLAYSSSDVLPSGITAAITAMTGGATNPVPTPMIAALSDVLYDVVACPWNDTTTYQAWLTEMTRRWNALVAREGCVVTAFHGTLGAVATQLAAMNSQFHDCYGSYNAPTPAFVEGAVIGAAYCTNLPNRPNAPQRDTLLLNIMGPAQADQLTFEERQAQYVEGGSCWIVGTDGNVYLEKAITTYKTNALGEADPTYQGRWVMATLTYLRRNWVTWMNTKFPNATFAQDGTDVIAGEVTPSALGLSTIAWYQAMMTIGLVQDLDDFKSALTSIQNPSNVSRNDQLMAPYLVPPLDIIAGQMAFVE